MNYSKIAIIGTGSVGSSTAYALMLKNIAAEIYLIDLDEKKCRGEYLDLSDTLSFSTTSKIKTVSYKDLQENPVDIIVIAAGARQQPGQSRTELITTNKKVISSIMRNLDPINPKTIVIMVTNPVDLMTLHAQQLTNLPKQQIFGTGTFLDSLRLRGLLSQKFNIAEESLHTYILGEHGDTQFPAWSFARVAGVQLTNFEGITQETLDALFEQTKRKAYEIIECKESTYYGIASCVTHMCQSIIFNKNLLMPLSCFIPELEVCLSMPTILGRSGINRIIHSPLNVQEQEKLRHSAQTLKNVWKR